MIKFFRRIRFDLLGENKTGKYFKYAIGEIVLVVIGILIALQINNWNEENKEISRSKQYHERIFEDLNMLIEDSDRLLSRTESTLRSITRTTEILESGKIQTEQDKETIEYALIWFSRTSYKLPELPTYQEMKSNGDLNLIYDVALRNKIASFNNFLKQVETVIDKLSYAIESDFRVYNRYIRTYVNPESLEVTYKYDFDKMIADNEFVNTFSRLSYHWRGYVYFMQEVLEDGQKLAVLFDQNKQEKLKY